MSSENHNLHISINEDIAERSGYHKNPCKYKGYCTDKKKKVRPWKTEMFIFFLLSWLRIFMELRCT